MTVRGATAPGKALLCGEYAVLEGAPAVVAAVDRRVSVSWSAQAMALPPEVGETLRLAQEECGPVPLELSIDASALQEDHTKLGLGSSAAAAVATAGAVFARHGYDLGERVVQDRVFGCALRGHASVAPQGSGVDVAAATYGGFLRFERGQTGRKCKPLRCPASLVIRLIWTGQVARTSELLQRVHRLRERDPSGYRECVRRLSQLSKSFAVAFEAGEAERVVEGAAEYAAAMRSLGDAAGAPIVEEQLKRASELAESFSGSAKPCGAGGGDVAVAFFVEAAAADAFEAACTGTGLRPIEVRWGATGVALIES